VKLTVIKLLARRKIVPPPSRNARAALLLLASSSLPSLSLLCAVRAMEIGHRNSCSFGVPVAAFDGCAACCLLLVELCFWFGLVLEAWQGLERWVER